MNLTTVNPSTTYSEGQIQKNIEKIRFRVSGAKLTTVTGAAQFYTDAASIYVTLTRHSRQLGEKKIWPRLTLAELLNATLGMEGYAKTTETDAALTYTLDFSAEISMLGNVDVAGGDYLALTVENGDASATVAVDLIPGFTKGNDHYKLTKTTLQANEQRRLPIDRAEFVVIPIVVSESRIVGDDTVTLNTNTLEGYLTEKSSLIFNMHGGATAQPTAAVLPANNIDYIDFTNGATACSILVFRQTDYNV